MRSRIVDKTYLRYIFDFKGRKRRDACGMMRMFKGRSFSALTRKALSCPGSGWSDFVFEILYGCERDVNVVRGVIRATGTGTGHG